MPNPDNSRQGADMKDAATALAGLRQFLLQPRTAETPHLLLLGSVGLGHAHLVEQPDRSGVICCGMVDEDGAPQECLMNTSAYALLVCIGVLGQSAFMNTTDGRPFLKVFGRASEKAGIVFARLLLGAEGGERVEYRDGDQLNLTFANLVLSSGRAKRGVMEWYPLALGHSASLPDALFPGTPEEKFEAAKILLRSAMERVETELGDLHASR